MVILELIHADRVPTGRRPPGAVASEGTLLLDQNRPGPRDRGPHKDLVTLNNFELIARSWYRRRIFQMSALSTVDGRFHAYRGGNG